MTELELINKTLNDCINCSRKDSCRIMLKSAIRYTKEVPDDSKVNFMVFEPGCGKHKRISIELIKEYVK